MCHYLLRLHFARPIFCHSAFVNHRRFRTLSLIAATSPWDTTKPICLSPRCSDDVQHGRSSKVRNPVPPSLSPPPHHPYPSFSPLAERVTRLGANKPHRMHRRRCLPGSRRRLGFLTRQDSRLGCAICMARNYKALSIIFQTWKFQDLIGQFYHGYITSRCKVSVRFENI